MGTVYRAVDRVLRRTVAVKLLSGLVADRDPREIARFEREARAAAKLSHPAVVAVYDTGEDQGRRFIVMEYVAGRSLEAILRAEGRLEPDRAVGVAARVADALAAAHAAGIVHRDIKPANVMVDDDGAVKVLDFGIARALDATTLTQTDTVLGTAAYMSPEQALGHAADERCDVYSLGCVLYALLTGHPPFTVGPMAAILHQHATLTPPSVRAQNPRVSPPLEALVMAMLAKSPEERPQHASQIRDQLTGATGQPYALPSAITTTKVQRHDATTEVQPRRTRPARRRGAVVAGAGALTIAAAVIALAASGGPAGHGTASHRNTHGTSTGTQDTHAHSSGTTGPARTTGTSPTPSASTAKPLTVAGAAGALTALVTGDAQAGTIDQSATQQITNDLTNVLNAYEIDNPINVQHMLAQLSQQATMLEQHGDVTTPAIPALSTVITNLTTALALAPSPAPETTPNAPKQPPASGQPPGHDDQPPGHAKHHDH